MHASLSPSSPEWRHSAQPVEYADAMAVMEKRVAEIQDAKARTLVWLLEHPPLYTAGTSARADDLLNSMLPVHETGRGGQYTYHGPGQRVAYVMMDLKKLFAPEPPDLRQYIKMLEQWIIDTLMEFGVQGFIREGRVGVWVNTPTGEAKIAAIGVRVKQWVAYHGIAINVHPDLSHYAGIVPCGIKAFGVTSLQALGINASLFDVDAALKKHFDRIFFCPH